MDICLLIQQYIATKLGISPSDVDPSERFHRLGIDSLAATSMIATVGRELGVSLSPTLAWQFPTPGDLARHLSGESPPRADAAPNAPAALRDEPIAIVGLACRFPGAADPDAFWALLRDGIDAVREVPKDRWDTDALFDADRAAPGKMSTRWAGLLDDVASFDAAFFGIAPREATHIDPQQRLMLELSWEAIEDAGMPASALKGTATGVFFGAMWMDYGRVPGATADRIGPHTATGQDLSIIPARVSYTLGLTGPSIAVNTACSSSLVAVHLARQSLLRGESRLAIAGSVNLLLSPESTIAMTKFGAMAPDGRSKAFDARANGYVRGEGGGVVALKRLSDAIADGDRIYCTIRGMAVNNDGFSNGLTAPNPIAQEAVIRDACADARTPPNDLQYVEAHGTGTMLGDPIEAGALGSVLGRGRAVDRPLRIGSVKTNIGHLEAAAGMAGLIKVALSMQRGQLPPSLHYRQPNPHIDFHQLRLRVQDSLEPWLAEGGRRLAGVSSFGFGGTNAHAVLEAVESPGTRLVRLAAPTAQQLVVDARALSVALRASPSVVEALAEPSDVEGRAHRLAVTARSAEELASHLEAFALGRPPPAVAYGTVPASGPQIVLVFGGQGSQWLGMGRSLLREDDAGRAALRRCDAALRGFVEWSLIERLERGDAKLLDDTRYAQAAIFSMQVALTESLRARGLRIDAVLGQSMGEVAAAHVAGALSLEDAVRVIFVRTELVDRIRGGRMAVVGLSLAEASVAIAPYGDRLSVAVAAGPESTVIAGEQDAMDALRIELEPRGVVVHEVRVDYASHSRDVDPLLPELRERLAPVRPHECALAFWSTVTGSPLRGESLDAAYWARNLREPVLFAPTIQSLASTGAAVFVEVDPHPVLSQFIEQCIAKVDLPAAVVSCGARDRAESSTLLDAVGRLFVAGCVARAQPAPARGAELVALSAKTPLALSALAHRFREHLNVHPEAQLRDIAYSLASTRSSMDFRLALAVPTLEALLEALDAEARGESSASSPDTSIAPSPKVVFVFPGQGSQWLGMGRQLLVEEPVFHAALTACDRAIAAETGWSVIETLSATAEASWLDRIDVVQPVLFAFAIGLTALWRSWGVEPQAVVGHSMGEVAAACVAGALSLEDGAAVICRRSSLLRRVSGQGEMALVELSIDQVKAELRGFEHRLGIAVSNSRRSTVLSGESGALAQVLAALEARGIFCRRIKVDVASHSPQVDPLLDELIAKLDGLAPRAALIPFRSTVKGVVLAGTELTGRYWADNLRGTVRFGEAIEALCADGFTLFIEMSPHPVLVAAVDEVRQGIGARGLAVGSLRREQPERLTLLESFGALHVHGHPLDPRRLFPGGGRRLPLPTYAWQREPYWIEAPDSSSRASARGHSGGHPLLGAPLQLSTQAGTWVWETLIDPKRVPWLEDHRVRGAVVFPASGYAEMALAVGAEVAPGVSIEVVDVEIAQILALPETGEILVQVAASAQSPGSWRIQIASRAVDQVGAATWSVHARAQVRHRDADSTATPADIASLQRELGEPLDVAALYATFATAGLEYGPAFRGILELRHAETEALARVGIPEAAGAAAPYWIHPSMLDSCFQVLEGMLADGSTATWLPVRIGSLRVTGRVTGRIWCRAQLEPSTAKDSDRRSANLTIFDESGTRVATVAGLLVQRMAERAAPHPPDERWLGFEWEACALPAERVVAGRWLLIGDGAGLGERLGRSLETAGHRVVRAIHGAAGAQGATVRVVDDTKAASLRALLVEAFGDAGPTAIVHLRSLDPGDDPDPIEAAIANGCDSVLSIVKAVTAMSWRDPPRLWVVTRGAQAVGDADVSYAQAPVLGLARVVAMEHSELRCARIDLDGVASADDVPSLHAELVADDGEDEVAWRGGARKVLRLTRARPDERPAPDLERAAGRPFAVRVSKPGVLDRLEFSLLDRRAPGPGEVEIEVEAAGINFRDVLLALGVIPNETAHAPAATAVSREIRPGIECAGRVVSIGEGVAGLGVGDPVIALARQGTMASHVTTPSVLVTRRPAAFSAAQGASVPVAYLTAWYALEKVGRLRPGERVLIHAATGGVGLAAVQWAQHVGAEIYATAGTAEKRELLEEMGVRFVSDSRSDRFVADVLKWTRDEGVDVVLNSLSGDLIAKSFSLLRPFGRFVELGVRDYYANNALPLRPFLKSLSFSLVDLLGMLVERPAWVGDLLKELLGQFEAGALSPPKVETFAISHVEDAFRKMAQGGHTGKLALALRDDEATVLVPTERVAGIRGDGSYVVTGGLGGLGLSIAGWLARGGAKHIVLIGRSGAATDDQRKTVAAIEARGTSVTVAAIDVADRAALAAVLAAVPNDRPLRGVFHAAGVLDDGLLADQTKARFRKVMDPKIRGAWNLHTLTRDADLDLFVLYASVNGLLGAPAQGNYAAANVFLDALAHHRRANGLPAISIDWGVFSEVGLAAAHEIRGRRLEGRGLRVLTPDEGLSALERVIAWNPRQIAVARFDARQWIEFYPNAAGSRVLSRLLGEKAGTKTPSGDRGLLERLAAASPESRASMVEAALREQVGKVLRIRPESVGRDLPLAKLGMDSLMGLELRNRIEMMLGVRLPAGALWTYPTLAALSARLSGTGDGRPSAAPSEPSVIAPGIDPFTTKIAAMDSTDLMSLLDTLVENANQGAR